MTRLLNCLALAFVLLAPTAGWGHPGHNGSGFLPGFLHPFLGWDHLLAMVAIGIWAVQLGGRAICAVPLAFVAAMALGAVLAASGRAVPMTEPLIAASVLMLGLLIGMKTSVPPAYGAMLVAFFALSHGAAHSTDGPAMTNALTYACGFLAATALLHATGIAAACVAHARPVALRVAAAPIALAGGWLLVTRLQ